MFGGTTQMDIKDVFSKSENGTLTLEQFEAIAKENDIKFADLSSGKYVSKSKYDSDLKAVNTQVESLNGQISDLSTTISTRDADLADLQKRLEAASEDTSKLSDVTTQLGALQTKYDNDMMEYQNKIRQQSYEFAVKEFANTKKFTSQAAKRDFTQAMIARNLQMEGDKLIGGEDFVEVYSKDNSDAFYVEPEPTPTPEPTPSPAPAAPIITAPTQGPEPSTDSGFGFNFTGVRPHN